VPAGQGLGEQEMQQGDVVSVVRTVGCHDNQAPQRSEGSLHKADDDRRAEDSAGRLGLVALEGAAFSSSSHARLAHLP
jgi:hypothetical protein